MGFKIKITHSVYRPFDIHVSGEELAELELSEITRSAASTLDRDEGCFFETRDGKLIFGFLTKWDTEKGAPRKGEFFFNIFTMDVLSVRDADLSDLRKKLENEAIESPDAKPSGTSTIEVRTLKEVNEETAMKIIYQWQKQGSAQADLTEISSLVSLIPRSAEIIKFVSNYNNKTEYYNIYENNGNEGKNIIQNNLSPHQGEKEDWPPERMNRENFEHIAKEINELKETQTKLLYINRIITILLLIILSLILYEVVNVVI